MSQKSKIIYQLNKKPMTQRELGFSIYGDYNHTTNIYTALMSLVNNKIISRTGKNPAIYALMGTDVSAFVNNQRPLKIMASIDTTITNELIEDAHQRVRQTSNYGQEYELVSRIITKFPNNTDLDEIAIKVAIIDITNSTNISRHKNKISVVEVAKSIQKIHNIDERIKNGDPVVVNEIARSNGKINLFSFATKYCCNHNIVLYKKDDYSIYDSILNKYLPVYFDDITKNRINTWRKNYQYQTYNNYITNKLDELGITSDFRKRKFDHFVWFNNK